MSISCKYLFLFFLGTYVCLAPQITYARFTGIGGSLDLDYDVAKKYINGHEVRKDEGFVQKYRLTSAFVGNLYNQNSGPYSLSFRYDHVRADSEIYGNKFSDAGSAFSWAGRFRLYLRNLKDLTFHFDRMERKDLSTPGSFAQEVEAYESGRRSAVITFGNNGGPRYYLSRYVEDRPVWGLVKRIVEHNFTVARGPNSITLDHFQDPGFSPRSALATTKRIRIGQFSIRNYVASAKHRISKARMKREWYRLTNWLRVSSMMLYEEKLANHILQSSDKNFDFALDGIREKWSVAASTAYSLSFEHMTGIKSQRLSLPVRFFYKPSQSTDYSWHSAYTETRSSRGSLTVSKSTTIDENFQAEYRPKANHSMDSRYRFSKTSSLAGETRQHDVSIFAYGRQAADYWLQASYQFRRNDTEFNLTGKPDSSGMHNIVDLSFWRPTSIAALSFRQSLMRSESESGLSKTRSSSDATSLSASRNFGQSTHASTSVSRNSSSSSSGDEKSGKAFRASLASKAELTDKASLNWDASHLRRENNTDGKVVSSSGMAVLAYKINSAFNSMTKYTKNIIDNDGHHRVEQDIVQESLRYTYFTNGFTTKRPYLVADANFALTRGTLPDVTHEDTYKLSVEVYPKKEIKYGVNYTYRWVGNSSNNSETIYLFFEYQLSASSFDASYWRRNRVSGSRGNDYLSLSFKRRF